LIWIKSAPVLQQPEPDVAGEEISMKEITIPITVIGPGSQPSEEDGATLDYIVMPNEMDTFEIANLPEPEDVEHLVDGLAALRRICNELRTYNVDDEAVMIDISDLDERNCIWVDQVLGHGEVSVVHQGGVRTDIQESVFAGVWRIQYVDATGAVIRDFVEISAIPDVVKSTTFIKVNEILGFDAENLPVGVMNATALVTELNDNIITWKAGDEPHVVNLSLLPHTPEDLVFLEDILGKGPVVILSRGYGNCRITSTATKNVWWVQYYNSQDVLILNTIEVSSVPAVACASQEDIEDSAKRVAEVMDIYA